MISSKVASILIIAGKGNNGGDGFVIHRWLTHWGYNCTTLLLASREKISGDAKINLEILDQMQEDVIEIHSKADLEAFWSDIYIYDLIVDAVLGTGLSGELRGLSRQVIEMINKSCLPVVAVDIPSGLDSITGKPLGVATKADVTLTFALPKLGLLQSPGTDYVGKLKVIDIGIPDMVVQKADIKRFWMNDDYCRQMLPVRPKDGHKGTFGRVLVLAGSKGMTGAAALTSEAVLRSGAGLVTLGIPASLNSIMEVKLTEVMTEPLPEKDGRFSSEGIDQIMELVKKRRCCGSWTRVGQSDELVHIIKKILEFCDKHLVIDADGLNNLNCTSAESLLSLLKERRNRKDVITVLTPHPGEMARLMGLSISEVQADRIGVAKKFVEEYGVILVLKGVPTIVVLPDGQIYLSSTGNSGMGTGGSGDVLTGIISGFLAQQPDSLSVPAAVYIHGLAGDLQAVETNQRCLIAGDLLKGLTLAFQKLEDRR